MLRSPVARWLHGISLVYVAFFTHRCQSRVMNVASVHRLVRRDCAPGLADSTGACCPSGNVDACGVCDGAGVVVDARGECCTSPLPPSGVCCTAELDSCGVCGGQNECGCVPDSAKRACVWVPLVSGCVRTAPTRTGGIHRLCVVLRTIYHPWQGPRDGPTVGWVQHG